MADEQIEALDPLTAVAAAHEFVVNDTDDTADDPGGTTKKITYANLHAYGEISVEGNETTTALPNTTDFSSAGTSGQLVIFGTDDGVTASNATASASQDHVQVTNAGTYFLKCEVSFSGSSNDTISFAFFKNNGVTKLGVRTTRKLGSGGDTGSASVSAIVTLAASDTVEIWAQNEGATNTITVEDASISVFRIG